MLSRSHSDIAMGTPSFFELKKQASFFFKEKIKTVRLALTDVTPVQLMTEEATDGKTWTPNTKTLSFISKAAFEFEDYLRIVDVLHKRLAKFEKRKWRMAYNCIVLLEHLLTHGPESIADEFHDDKYVIAQMETFQYIDEKGFNWGLVVRRKSETVLKLLEKGTLLKEERKRARELSRGIQGFGSFNHNSKSSFSSDESVLQESTVYRKYNSKFNERNENDDQENGIADSAHLKPRVLEDEKDENAETNPFIDNTKDKGSYFIKEYETHPFRKSDNEQMVVSLLSD